MQNLSAGDGSPIVEMPWTNDPSQRFRLEAVGDGSFYRIVNISSGLALTVQNGLSVKGNAII